MNYLSLFSGACGGDLGLQHLLGWKCRGYVEHDSYCQKVIKQRIADGFLDAAPIFGDIRDFNKGGFAGSYQGFPIGWTALEPLEMHKFQQWQ